MKLSEYIAITAIVGYLALIVFVIFYVAYDAGLIFAKGAVLVPELTQSSNGPPRCAHLYNVGQSQEWRKCMGVEEK